MNSMATVCWESWSLEIFHPLENHNANDPCAQVCAHTRGSRVWRTIKREFRFTTRADSSPSRFKPVHPSSIRLCGWRLAVCRMLLPTPEVSTSPLHCRRNGYRDTHTCASNTRWNLHKGACTREREGWSELA